MIRRDGVAGYWCGFFSGLGETNGTLIIDGQGAGTPFSPISIPPGFTFDNITVRNNARAIIDSPLSITGTFSVLDNSIVTHTVASEPGLTINAAKVVVDSTSSIDVSARGYRGGLNSGRASCDGETLGGLNGSVYRSGGSHGGIGGVFQGTGPNVPYGDIKNPSYLGSGGSCGGSFNVAGGNGGGRITINATESVQVDGAIRADGQNSPQGFQAGNGAGGAIKITTSNLKGTGFISAEGRTLTGGFNEVGGGGGRIAIFYDFLGVSGNDLNGTLNITVAGGKGTNRRGSAGSIYLKRSDQQDGDLILDEVSPASTTAAVVTPIGTRLGFGSVQDVTADTLTTDGLVALLPNGLVGLTLVPNLNSNLEYTITSNTANTITVDTTNKPALTSVTDVGETYSGLFRFDNVNFRRGTFAMLGDKLAVNDTLLVAESSFLSHYDSNTTFSSHLDIEAGTVQIDALSRIDASGRGYLGGLSDTNSSCNGQTIPSLTGAQYRSGGSYGGFGGVYQAGVTNALYGDISDPTDLGSGGSCGGSFNIAGGDGGGYIRIAASSLIVNGELASNGARTPGGFQAGNGSGGSINLSVGTLSGSGFIRTNGDTTLFGGFNEVSGGGGRIAIRYSTLALPQSNIQSLGGQGNNAVGGQGTIFLKGPGQTQGDLLVDGGSLNTPDDRLSIPPNVTFDNVILRNNARVVLTSSLTSTGSVQLLSGSRLTHPVADEDGAQIVAASLFVDSTSAIDVSGRGYQGGLNSGNGTCNGLTLGSQPGAIYRSGGSYGGAGGVFDGAGSNQVYGIPQEPIYLGSGGSCGGSFNVAGGNGGGRIEITLGGNATIDGTLRADGQNSVQGFQAGNGSGGSILVSAANISGTGKISANGFSPTGGFNEVSGGGGRIALFYDTFGAPSADFNGTLDITATGGHGNNRSGSSGTVYLKPNSAARGDLIIDEGLAAGTSSIASLLTPVGFGTVSAVTPNTLTFDLTRRVVPGGLVGVQINPNLNQLNSYLVLSNSDSQATLSTQGTDLTTITAAGQPYAALYRFRNVTLRRGALLESDDLLRVDDTLLISSRSILTHRGATLNSTSRLDLTAATLSVDNTSRIDVSARGYLGGLQLGNACSGRTTLNATGSTYRSGGSYGGLGGAFQAGVPNPVYGSATDPADLGSGGSCGGSFNVAGGNGGGWFKGAFNSILLDGSILANGQNSPSGFQAGNGSGGTINILTSTLSGAGSINANGTNPGSGFNEVGGGGGRIRIAFTSNTLAGAITANGGAGNSAVGGNGTVSLQQQ